MTQSSEPNDALAHGQVLLAAARSNIEKIQAYLKIGDAQHDLAEYDSALKTFAQAEILARHGKNPQWIAECLSSQVRVAGGQSKYASVLKMAREAVGLARAANQPSTLAKALHWLGNTEFYLGNISTAQGLLEEALAVVRGTDDPLRVATTMTLLGRIHGQAGRQHKRIELLMAALKINQDLGYQKGIAMCLTGLSWTMLLEGKFADSERLSLEALGLLRAEKSKWATANTLLNLSHARLGLGFIQAARQNLLEALEIATQIGSNNLLLELLVAAARAEHSPEHARRWIAIAVMHPNSTAELRSFAAPDIERLEIALKSVDAASLAHILPEVKARLEQG